jgi:hypothetical protein
LIAGLYLFAIVLTQLVGGQVTALIVGPIAVSAAVVVATDVPCTASSIAPRVSDDAAVTGVVPDTASRAATVADDAAVAGEVPDTASRAATVADVPAVAAVVPDTGY